VQRLDSAAHSRLRRHMSAITRAALGLACCMAVAALADDEVVDWRDAAQCVGRVCGVRGTVAATENDGPSIRLYFDSQQRDVRVLLMRGWLVSWPHYDGETIVATGKVDRFRDHVEVMVLDPSSVEVLSPTPSPTPPAALPAGTPSEVEELRHKVRELEQRLRELEGR
jgi:hypothetical protein